MRALHRFSLAALLASAAWAVQAVSLVPGDLYSANSGALNIRHYDRSGNLLESTTLSDTYGLDVRGLAFGPQGWLYAVASTSTGTAVYAFDGSGSVRESYSSEARVDGDPSFGNIAFGKDGRFFVGGIGTSGQSQLMAFTLGQASAALIDTAHPVVDIAALPSGNLLVLSAQELNEITPHGDVVKSRVESSVKLTEARGVAYDAANQHIYVSMQGDGAAYDGFHLVRLDARSGELELGTRLWYANHLLATDDNRLAVGIEGNAWLFDASLADVISGGSGSLVGGPGQLIFMTQMSLAVPEPSTAGLMALGVCWLVARRRRPAAA